MKNVRQGKVDTVQGGNKGEVAGGAINQHITRPLKLLVVWVDGKREPLKVRGLRRKLRRRPFKGRGHIKGKE